MNESRTIYNSQSIYRVKAGFYERNVPSWFRYGAKMVYFVRTITTGYTSQKQH